MLWFVERRCSGCRVDAEIVVDAQQQDKNTLEVVNESVDAAR